MSDELIDAQKVIDALDGLDDEERAAAEKAATEKAAAEAADKAKQEAQPKDPKPKPAPAVRGQDDPALQVAWSLVEDHIKETCPDLDEEILGIVKAAAGNDPMAFKAKAKQMQAKLAAKKNPDETDSEKLKRDLTSKVFDGGGQGGDPVVVKVKQPTTEEKMKEAVAKGNSQGILQGVVQTIADKKMFDRGVGIVID